MEGIATEVSESMGIPAMLVRVGALQVALVVLLAVVGGKRLWRFGLHDTSKAPKSEPSALQLA